MIIHWQREKVRNPEVDTFKSEKSKSSRLESKFSATSSSKSAANSRAGSGVARSASNSDSH